MLSWAAANENEWYLGVKRDAKPWEPPVPFFPELNEDLTKTLNGPFLAHTYQSGSPPPTSLDGGAAMGYDNVPQVERAVAVHLFP